MEQTPMETNPRLEQLRSVIGKEFKAHYTPSPFTRWLQPKVRKVEPGNLVFEYTVREEMLNPAGTLHGGVTAAIMDDLIGATAYSLNEEGYFHPTINLSVDYFATARAGDSILVETQVAKRGRQIVNMLCEVWNNDKTRILARGTSNLIKMPLG